MRSARLTIYSHRDLETVLAGFNVACNARRQRVPKGRSPDAVLRDRLTAKPELPYPLAKSPNPETLPKALRVIATAKEVSHPDSWSVVPADCLFRAGTEHPPTASAIFASTQFGPTVEAEPGHATGSPPPAPEK